MTLFKIIILSLSVLLTVPGFSAPSEAEYVKLSETWNLLPDGSQEYRCYKELTLFTHTAMNGTYGETFIVYNPLFQELKIHDSYTRQKDGTLIRTPENAFVEVLPRNAEKAPAYNHLKEMVIVHTGLELGATLVLDYSILSKPGYLPALDVCRQLNQSSPVREYQLAFNLPAGIAAHYTTLGIEQEPGQITSADIRHYKWIFRNLKAASREPQVQLQNGDVPALLFHTFASPQETAQTLGRQFDSPSAVAQLAERLTKNASGEKEKLQAIHQYILTQVDHCHLSLSESGFRLRPAAQVIQTAYGTDIEKINLLSALLNAAGIPAIPAAACSVAADPADCGLQTMGELLVVAEAAGKTYRLNTRSFQPAAVGCNFIVNLTDGNVLPCKQEPAHLRYQADIQWKEGKNEAKVKATFTDNYLSYAPDFAQELLAVRTDRTVTGENETTTVNGNTTAPVSAQQDYLILTLPQTHKGILQEQGYHRFNSKRTVNLLLPNVLTEEYDYTLRLPADLTLCTPEKEITLNNAAGSLHISLRQEGQDVHIRRTLDLPERLITPDNYPAFRQLITEWADPQGQQLLLKKSPEK